MNKKQKLVLAIIATDNTFEKFEFLGAKDYYLWVGKCIFCNKKRTIGQNGSFVDLQSTIEHIIPKSRGGTDDIENLAIACRNCNGEKGRRHDKKKSKRYRAVEIVSNLQRKRMERWRK